MNTKRGQIALIVFLFGVLATTMSMFFYFASGFISLNAPKLSPGDGYVPFSNTLESYLIIGFTLILIIAIIKLLHIHIHFKIGKSAKKAKRRR